MDRRTINGGWLESRSNDHCFERGEMDIEAAKIIADAIGNLCLSLAFVYVGINIIKIALKK